MPRSKENILMFSSLKAIKFWNYDLNKNIDPLSLRAGSTIKAWFNCNKCLHSFQISILNVKRGIWCKYCSNHSLCDNQDCKICEEKSFSSSDKAVFWSEKNVKTPREVFKGTPTKYWFHCEDCGHDIFIALKDIKRGRWCGYCGITTLCSNKDCTFCFKRSFASHKNSRFWSSKNKKSARETFKGSGVLVLFECDCGHVFESQPCRFKKSSCPYCCYPPQKLCKDLDCDSCYHNSFQSSDKIDYWSTKNEESPRFVFKSSGSKYLFDCNICDHEFERPLNAIKQGSFCPFCANKRLCSDKDCKLCKEKSFDSHPRRFFWSYENLVEPRQVFKSSHRKYKFICEINHKFEKSLDSITNGTWCPSCFRKGEQKLYDFLIKHYEVIRESKFEWCFNEKTSRKFPYDFEILNGYKTLIEIDGGQHFVKVMKWTDPKITQMKDIFKMNKANENGYSVIRITWDMVVYDKGNWMERLISAIEETDWCSRTFICEKNEYEVYD